MKDKKTIYVVIGCLIAMFAWQALVNIIFPPRPKPPETPFESAQPPPERYLPEPAFEAIEEPVMVEEPTFDPQQPRPDEKIVALRNEFVRLEITSWGGGIRSAELLKYRANGEDNILLNGPGFIPALTLTDIPGAGLTAVYQIEKPNDWTVVMRTQTPKGLMVTKTLSLGEGYGLEGVIEIDRRPRDEFTPPTARVVVGTARPANAKEPPEHLGVSWSSSGKFRNLDLKKALKQAKVKPYREVTVLKWAAVKNQFFAMILTPSTNGVALTCEVIDLPPPEEDAPRMTTVNGLSASLEMQPSSGEREMTETYEFTFYAGPKKYERLVKLGQGQEEIMQFGFFGVISVLLLQGMNFFYGIIPNYGISIILITIVIKILFWPIQSKSIRSMKEMQKFQPAIQKLREKYKDDAQRMNQETMKLYKEHKINPMASCLPMVVQLPVFFALFSMLRTAVELRGAAFMWINDLSQPDTVAHLVGLPINPLPLVMGITMIWQMKLTPTTGDPKQAQFMKIMPLFFLFICYRMSSGLVLYWTVQQLLSIAQQWWSLRKSDKPASTSKPLPAGKVK